MVQEGSKRPLGSSLEGFEVGSGRIWEGLGRILAKFWVNFGKIWGRILATVEDKRKIHP